MSTPATIVNTLTNVNTALGTFILQQLGLASGQVIQGYPNRTSMPVGPFVAFYAIFKKRLRTNIDTYSGTSEPAPAPGPEVSEQGMQVDIQIDCYGPSSSDWSDILSTLLRDQAGCTALGALFPSGAANCQPLYADDPVRAPLIDAEQQYEDKWIVQARIQYNPQVTTSAEYAVTLGPASLVDVTPGGGFAPPA